ncbi:hypothetical protein STA1M1_21630 [Sinisalibacter aestuarii]|uniref:Uncharacterized protein n=1 Tax=Sinisalibacter aestuarii TaxID=2949426 RepID=A0ABQ5LTH9_9RHOB|nr:hypothetical protein STA1M1_21630 [Sinisalibacter aestuarii]
MRRHDAIRRSVETIPGGIRAVTESDDPEIAGLIRAHGVVVTGFVRSGGNAAGQPSPLPDDYVRVIS